MEEEIYKSFLSSPSARQWERIGIHRRAGVIAPLFSVYSKESSGIGEIPDLKKLIDWCETTGLGILQLLPMNDVGFDFRPYDAQSAFALEPMYLSLANLTEVETKSLADEIQNLKGKFSPGESRVDYEIKAAKLGLLWKIFRENKKKKSARFDQFLRQNKFWIQDYALFKVIKGECGEKGWMDWGKELKERDATTLQKFSDAHLEAIQFQKWLQWQLFEQFIEIKKYAEAKKILLMGDLPFLVSRDSADVWAHQEYFKLDLLSGAPPDMYFATGQRWGMPPYQWSAMAERGYDFLIEKLKYAENFYDLFRIDHVIGVFRLWTIPASEPPEAGALNGAFDPVDEQLWEGQGRKLLSVMIENTRMLPCAEDLGVVPECSYRVLEEFGIPGIDIQRWTKDWGKSYSFKNPQEYRKNSVAMLSTHDSSAFCGWWEFEAGTIDEALFGRKCAAKNLSFDEMKKRLFDPAKSHHGRLRWKKEINNVPVLLKILGRTEVEVSDLVELYRGSYMEKEHFWDFVGFFGNMTEKPSVELTGRALQKINEAASIFSVQLLQDWLALGSSLNRAPWDFRINFPGRNFEGNWAIVMPMPLEEMKGLPMNRKIHEINAETRRIPVVKSTSQKVLSGKK